MGQFQQLPTSLHPPPCTCRPSTLARISCTKQMRFAHPSGLPGGLALLREDRAKNLPRDLTVSEAGQRSWTHRCRGSLTPVRGTRPRPDAWRCRSHPVAEGRAEGAAEVPTQHPRSLAAESVLGCLTLDSVLREITRHPNDLGP